MVTCDVLDEKVKDESIKFIITFFGSETNTLFTEAHVPYANAEDKILFLNADLACQEKHGLSGDDKIVFFRNFE